MTCAAIQPASVPEPLRSLPQWVNWRTEIRNGKPTKPPINSRTANYAEVDDHRTWSTLEVACRALPRIRGAGGIGFVFSQKAGVTGIDFDHCRNRNTGEIETWAKEIIEAMNSYSEISPSGDGIHVFIYATMSANAKHTLAMPNGGKLEIYDRLRFFTFTGNHLSCTPVTIESRQVEFDALYKRLFSPAAPAATNHHDNASPSLGAVSLPDRELIDKAMHATNGSKFTRLWNGDTSDYEGDDSRADLALCCMLAYWTNCDSSRMDALFRQSGLMRDKWERHDYRERTIDAALTRKRDTCNPGQAQESVANSPKVAVVELEAPVVAVPESKSDAQELAAWPDPIDDAAMHGLAGQLVAAIEPHTEADTIALLIQTLIAFGNAAGRNAYFQVEGDRHYTNLNTVLVGETSKARKGTSWGRVKSFFDRAEPQWRCDCLKSGLSSGEGLIWAVRDAIENDRGVVDKRLLVSEPEFASTLRVLGRDGNTLSAVIRDAFDNGNLATLTKNSAARATGAHISIVGHITRQELLRYLDSTEAGNGFGNRFLWACVRRSKVLPEGGGPIDGIEHLASRLTEALRSAGRMERVEFDEDARATWRSVYPELSAGQPALFGAITARAEAQVVRMALVYAMLDCSPAIRLPHLRAALAMWEYCKESARFIWGDSLGDPDADVILAALFRNSNGLTRTEISNLFHRNRSAGQIERAISLLLGAKRVRAEILKTEGRDAELFIAGRGTKKTKETKKE